MASTSAERVVGGTWWDGSSPFRPRRAGRLYRANCWRKTFWLLRLNRGFHVHTSSPGHAGLLEPYPLDGSVPWPSARPLAEGPSPPALAMEKSLRSRLLLVSEDASAAGCRIATELVEFAN